MVDNEAKKYSKYMTQHSKQGHSDYKAYILK